MDDATFKLSLSAVSTSYFTLVFSNDIPCSKDTSVSPIVTVSPNPIFPSRCTDIFSETEYLSFSNSASLDTLKDCKTIFCCSIVNPTVDWFPKFVVPFTLTQ